MARARDLKPGFFKNPELVELPFEYRILFEGLWCLADREGRLEDRAKRIRMEIFPADDVDCEAGLHALAGKRLIVRYEVEGNAFIWIPAFLKHQHPHPREVASVIPAYPGASSAPVQENLFSAEAPPRTGAESSKGVASPAGSSFPSGSSIPSSTSVEKLASRLPAEWKPSDELFAWAMQETHWPHERIEREVEKFRDYWTAKPGKDGRKTDWAATWRNWIRKAMESGPGPRGVGRESVEEANARTRDAVRREIERDNP